MVQEAKIVVSHILRKQGSDWNTFTWKCVIGVNNLTEEMQQFPVSKTPFQKEPGSSVINVIKIFTDIQLEMPSALAAEFP